MCPWLTGFFGASQLAQVATIEGIVSFAAEWCTTNEAVILRCVSASLFVVVNEWQHKDILDDKDRLTWEEMSEDWNACLSERSTSPAVQ